MSMPQPEPLPRPDLLADQSFPPPPQQARSRRKRDALIPAALALFAEHGYEQATIEAIAQRAEVAVGAFYQHFTSKRQVLLVLMDRLLREAEALETPITEGDLSQMPALIRRLVYQGLQVDWAYAGAYRAWREAAVMDAQIRALQHDIEQWLAQRLAGIIILALQAPGARQQVHVPEFSWILSILFWRLAETPLAEPDAVVDTVTDLICRTLFVDA